MRFLPDSAPIRCRADLSFTAQSPDHGRIINWLPARVPPQVCQWEQDVRIGAGMALEVVRLAANDECEARAAIRYALISPNFLPGSGVEAGFVQVLAAFAVAGMRASNDPEVT